MGIIEGDISFGVRQKAEQCGNPQSTINNNQKTIRKYTIVYYKGSGVGNAEFNRRQIQYIINGIQDRTENKIVLYGARTIQELKEKINIYENIKKNSVCDEQKTKETKTFIN